MKKITAYSQFNEKNELEIDWKVSGLNPISHENRDLVVDGYIFNAKELSDFLMTILNSTGFEDLSIEGKELAESIRKRVNDSTVENAKYSMSTETK